MTHIKHGTGRLMGHAQQQLKEKLVLVVVVVVVVVLYSDGTGKQFFF